MPLAKHALCAAALLALPVATHGATVTPYEMAFFSFDTSKLTLTNITASAFACIFETQCFEAEGLLAPGNSLSVSYGVTLGGNELGTRSYTNTFPTPVNNAAGNILNSPLVTIPATADEVFATFGYVDDTYTVTDFRIFTEYGPLAGTALAAPAVAAMPLSASGWMMMLGLAGLGLFGRNAMRHAPRRI